MNVVNVSDWPDRAVRLLFAEAAAIIGVDTAGWQLVAGQSVSGQEWGIMIAPSAAADGPRARKDRRQAWARAKFHLRWQTGPVRPPRCGSVLLALLPAAYPCASEGGVSTALHEFAHVKQVPELLAGTWTDYSQMREAEDRLEREADEMVGRALEEQGDRCVRLVADLRGILARGASAE